MKKQFTIEDFIIQFNDLKQEASLLPHGQARQWLNWSNIQVYIRIRPKSYPDNGFPQVDIANIGVTTSGKGIFTSIREYLESQDFNVLVESVMSQRFIEHLEKQGYVNISPADTKMFPPNLMKYHQGESE